MPRSNAKRSTERRHVNASGLAAPAKKRSNPQLNGQPNGQHAASNLPPPTASDAAPNDPTASPGRNNAAPVHAAHHRDRTASEVSFEEVVSPGGDMADTQQDYAEAQSTANKSSAPPAGSPLAIVSTILTYYPLRDAISILILLLSLPPTLVLIIQTLFASLTFVPPTAGISLSTLPNVKDMFNASSLGYPALATILLVDLIFYLCWLPVWKPMQSMFLDLSQTVIAVSLSGAASSNGGPTYSILTCSTVVCVVHVLRYKAIHLTALDYLRSVLHRMDIGFDVNVPSAASSFLFSAPSQHGWLYTAVRTMLGIHIVSQGVTTCIRRSLASANERNSPQVAKSDTEAAAGADSAPRSYSTDDVKHPPPTLNGDVRLPGPSPAHRESKVRESSSKKKRKQANQVRSQQPLWAAIASTKVTFVKEMEQRDAADDAKEAASMDNDTNDTYSNSSINSTDRIWTCDVRDTDIKFGVELTSQSASESIKAAEDVSTISPTIDKSKPFFIRVNGAAWSSTRIISCGSEGDSNGKWWGGEIFGLAPLSSYHCEVVGMGSTRVLCSANLITLAAPTAEQAASAPVQPQHQALRPSSPITTLKQSIQQAESKLADAKNKSKKSKKDQRNTNADIKREINSLKGKVDGSGGMDDKQLRRQQQITQHKNQAEEATIDLKAQMEALGELPADEVAASESKRRAWQSAMDARNSANRDLEVAKADADRVLKELKSEISATASKREKLAQRHQQRTEELAQAIAKQQADQSARYRHETERAHRRQENENTENQLQYHVANMQAEIDEFARKALEAYQQATALQSWGTGVPPGFMGVSSPPTPENQLPNLNGTLSPNNGYSAYGPMHVSNGYAPAVPAPRGRSSSMLSQYSGFTDDAEDYVFEPRHQHTWPMQGNAVAGAAVIDERNHSEGSGSGTNGSTASNSPKPAPTAKPFIPADAAAKPFIPAASRQSLGASKQSSQSAGTGK